jgi:hypothetical protein
LFRFIEKRVVEYILFMHLLCIFQQVKIFSIAEQIEKEVLARNEQVNQRKFAAFSGREVER